MSTAPDLLSGAPRPAIEPAAGGPAQRALAAAPGALAAARARASARALRALGLAAVVALAAVMDFVRLAQNGYANTFYSASVKSMLGSLHDFLFASFDPGALISVDKPPLALWVQVASAKLFGFAPLSLLVPEALLGVLAVAALYVVLARRLGTAPALAGGVALAAFPAFVAVSRDNGVDPLLLALLVLACAAGTRAAESGRWRALLASAVLLGLAFNTKTLAAYLALPGIALAYLACAPLTLRTRILRLLAAGVLTGALSFAWIVFVDGTQASQRPYVGSSTDNSELGLAFGYNGFGRVEGQSGGPGGVPVRAGAFVPVARVAQAQREAQPPRHGGARAARPAPRIRRTGVPGTDHGREGAPIPFGGPPGLLRLFGKGLGDQAGWVLPLALCGLLGMGCLLALERRERTRAGGEVGSAARGDVGGAAGGPPAVGARAPRLALLLCFGGWFAVEFAVLSVSKGIVHPYYTSGLAPGAAAMIGCAAAALAGIARRRGMARVALLAALAVLGIGGSAAAEVVLMHRYDYMAWFAPALIAGCALLGAALLILRRGAPAAIALALALLLATPAAYASTTWLAPVEGTFPVAGPRHNAGTGGLGIDGLDLRLTRALMRYAHAHDGHARFELLTVSSDTAAPMILLGARAAAVAGYSATDQALSGAGLARLVREHRARYVVLGGDYSLRGGNGATHAVLRACRLLAPSVWEGEPLRSATQLVLFDCSGRESALEAA